MYNESIEYKGYTIDIEQDQCAGNPFEEWDCNPPILVNNDRSITEYGDIDLYAPTLTRQQIVDNAKRICELTGAKSLLALSTMQVYRHEYGCGVDLVNDAIAEYINDLSDCDKINELPEFYALTGIVALSGVATGYSQGDYIEILVVATAEWLKLTGATIDKPEDLQFAIDLYGQWAFGDVYAYTLPEIHDSCGGFYGDDHEKSGLFYRL